MMGYELVPRLARSKKAAFLVFRLAAWATVGEVRPVTTTEHDVPAAAFAVPAVSTTAALAVPLPPRTAVKVVVTGVHGVAPTVKVDPV